MKAVRFCMAAVLLLVAPLMGWAQEKLFDKYSDMKEVKSVYISKTMLDMNTNVFMSDLYVGKAKNLNSVRLLSTMDNKVRRDMAEDIRSLVKSSKYELLMKQKGLTSKSEFYVSRRGGQVKELIMVMDGAASLKFVYLEGNMTDQEVRQILMNQSSSSVDGTRIRGAGEPAGLEGAGLTEGIGIPQGLAEVFRWRHLEAVRRADEGLGQAVEGLGRGVFRLRQWLLA